MHKLQMLNYPSYFALENAFIRIQNNREARTWIKKINKDGSLLCKFGSSRNMKLHFILDNEGKFYRLERSNLIRKWLAPISSIYDFTIVKCKVELVEGMLVSELLEIINTKYPSRNTNFPNAGRLRKFLLGCNKSEVIDNCIMKKFNSYLTR